jgi:uncharacterized protein YmfQ (DUF2313 family)
MHSNVLIQAIHFCYNMLDDELRAMVDVIGEFFDTIEDVIDSVLIEMYPATATIAGMLPDYEQYYRCIALTGDSVEMRRNRVVAAIRTKGGLNRDCFYRIADALGYSIGAGIKYLTIEEGNYKPFRAGISRAGIDAVYDQSVGASMFDVVVTGTDVETDADLHSGFERQRAAGINFIYVNV